MQALEGVVEDDGVLELVLEEGLGDGEGHVEEARRVHNVHGPEPQRETVLEVIKKLNLMHTFYNILLGLIRQFLIKHNIFFKTMSCHDILEFMTSAGCSHARVVSNTITQ